jgi:hypothetical protein
MHINSLISITYKTLKTSSTNCSNNDDRVIDTQYCKRRTTIDPKGG